MKKKFFVTFDANNKPHRFRVGKSHVLLSLSYMDAPLGAEVEIDSPVNDLSHLRLALQYPEAMDEPTVARQLRTVVAHTGRVSGRLFSIEVDVKWPAPASDTQSQGQRRTLAEAVTLLVHSVTDAIRELRSNAAPGQQLNYDAAVAGLKLNDEQPAWLVDALQNVG